MTRSMHAHGWAALNNPFVVFGLMLSVLAGLAAFVITYDEWSHHSVSKAEMFRRATHAAAFAFLVFAGVTVLGYVFINLVVSY